MSRSTKFFVGILSFLPILLTAGLFITFFITFTNNWGNPEPTFASPLVFREFSLFVAGIFVLSIGLLIYFIVHVTKQKKMDSTERAIWILAFVLGGAISYPIYWYMKIWKEEE